MCTACFPFCCREGMVRIALMRMMADEERENAHNAACLTKFAELLVLNDVMTTEQMWRAFSLVGDMYHSSGAMGLDFVLHVAFCLPCALLPKRDAHADVVQYAFFQLRNCSICIWLQARGRRSCRRWRSGWSTPTS